MRPNGARKSQMQLKMQCVSANMSLGISLFPGKQWVSENQTSGVEHHSQKIDAPSGTAVMIADAINAALGNSMDYVYGRRGDDESLKRKPNQIGIHAVRGGTIVGEHDAIFAGPGEVVEIRHAALSRDIFGYGALEAARFLPGKPPELYSMKDVIESKAV